MKKYILTPIFILTCYCLAMARDNVVPKEDIFTPVLAQIERHSTTLKALRERTDADIIGNKTGLTPANPEVEFGYLWGAPSGIGNRQDISVSQSFDFPSVYIHKSKLSNMQNTALEHAYNKSRQELLLQAKTLCVELVYYNALINVYGSRLTNAQTLAEAYAELYPQGDVTKQDYNKAMLNLTAAQNDYDRTVTQRNKLLSRLAALNGGEEVAFTDSLFPVPYLIEDFETWYASTRQANPALSYLHTVAQADSRLIKLTKASALPKLSVGYMGEFVTGERFQGLTVGISIPLWENRHTVRHAKAVAMSSQTAAEDACAQHYANLKELYATALALNRTLGQYNAVLDDNDGLDALSQAYDAGELTLLDYLLEQEYYIRSYEQRLGIERDLFLTLAQLYACYL